MHKALFVIEDRVRWRVYPDDLLETFAAHVDFVAPPHTKAQLAQNPAPLHEAELLITTWGCPRLDADFLDAAPRLQAVFYGAGSVKDFVTDDMWQRGIRLTHAADGIAQGVVEFVLAQILLSLKGMWSEVARVKAERRFRPKDYAYPGVRGATVGIIGLGLVGRKLIPLLQPFGIRILAHDPYASAADEEELGIKLVSLEELFSSCEVVSLHAPWLPETVGMIHRGLLERMPQNSTFINSARGALVREDDLIAVLRERPDITALLDVSHPEPPVADSPLYQQPNLILTPHIAGPVGGRDTRRLGELMLEEVISYSRTGELRYEVTRAGLATMA